MAKAEKTSGIYPLHTPENPRVRRLTGLGLMALIAFTLGIDYSLYRQARKNDALANAVQGNDIQGVQRLLGQGADPNAHLLYQTIPNTPVHLFEWIVGTRNFSWRCSPVLSVASTNGNAPLVEILLDRGADMNGLSQNGWTPLMVAAGAGKMEVVRLFLRRGVALNTKNEFKNTALKIALDNNRREIVQVIRQAGGRE